MTRRLVLLLTLASTPIAAIQQTPPRDNRVMPSAVGTGVIAGTVVTNDPTPAPVRRAEVILYFGEGGIRTTVTNDAGAFAFSELPAARFTLQVSKNGYLTVHYGAKRPGEVVGRMSIALASGQRITDINLKMPRGSVIAGRVLDLNGQPAARASVQVLKSSLDWRTGLRQFAPQGGAEADDRGVYRIYGLPPGDYIVSASTTDDRTDFKVPTSAEWQWADAQLRAATPAQSGSDAPPAGRTMAYAPVFFPSTPVQANAGVIKLGLTEERAGIDIQLNLVPTGKIEGQLTTASDSVTANIPVRLLRRGEGGTGTIQVNQVVTDADGKFSFTGVAPGSYFVTSRSRPASAPATASTTWALRELEVAGQDQNVSLELQAGLPVTGQVVLDHTTNQAPLDLTRVRVALMPMVVGGTAVTNPGLLASVAGVDASGRIVFTDVSPGQYRVQASVAGGPAGGTWSLRSAIAGGVDAVDLAIDIKPGDSVDLKVTFTDRPSELTGLLQTASGRPAPDYFIILFPANEQLWLPQSRRILALRPDNEGRYRAPNLPAGDYLLSAVTDVEQNEWYDPAYLAQLKLAAIRLTIGEGERKSQDLKIGGLR